MVGAGSSWVELWVVCFDFRVLRVYNCKDHRGIIFIAVWVDFCLKIGRNL